MQWLLDHLQLISALTSLGMLVIWLLYLQLFYRSYRRQQRPHLLVHQAGGFGLDGLCLVSNMSEGPVHVAVVLVDAERGGRRVTFQPGPDARPSPDDDDPLRRLLQGPLAQGDYVLVGTFREILQEAEHRLPPPSDEGDGEEEATEITIRIVSFVGAEVEPAGTRRRFRVRGRGADADADVRPVSLLPEQLASHRERRAVRRWLVEAQELEPLDIAAPGEDAERIRRALKERRSA